MSADLYAGVYGKSLNFEQAYPFLTYEFTVSCNQGLKTTTLCHCVLLSNLFSEKENQSSF